MVKITNLTVYCYIIRSYGSMFWLNALQTDQHPPIFKWLDDNSTVTTTKWLSIHDHTAGYMDFLDCSALVLDPEEIFYGLPCTDTLPNVICEKHEADSGDETFKIEQSTNQTTYGRQHSGSEVLVYLCYLIPCIGLIVITCFILLSISQPKLPVSCLI